MLEEFISAMPLWQKIIVYAYLLLGLFIFVKTSNLKFMDHPIISLKWRIILAVFFPVILGLGVIFGVLLLGIGIAFFGLMALSSILTGKKIKRPTIPRLRINVVRK